MKLKTLFTAALVVTGSSTAHPAFTVQNTSNSQLRRFEVALNQPRPANCDPAYPDGNMCIPIGTSDIDCPEIPYFKNFTVLQPDPHRFDGDGDGKGCEPYRGS